MKGNTSRTPIKAMFAGSMMLAGCGDVRDSGRAERDDDGDIVRLERAITAQGSITVEKWLGVAGTAVSSIPVATPPSSITQIGNFEIPTNAGDQYGVRVRGFILPPATGSYTFWIASDDNGELYLGTNADPATRRRIAFHTGFTNSREWNKFPTQRSTGVNLTAGQRYYIEALMKEGSGGDNLAVGWLKPGQTGSVPSEVIPGTRMAAFEPPQQPITREIQAEDGFLFQGVVETEHAGFTGTGYVNLDNRAGSSLDLLVDAPYSGPATLDIRYANGTTSARQTELTVNGTVVNASLAFAPTGAWTTWSTVRVSVGVDFFAGGNSITLRSINAAGPPNFDRVTVTFPPSSILIWPLFGNIGESWVVSQYVDVNPAPSSAVDFTGGNRTFDGNPSTEIDVSSFREIDNSVGVRTVASGVIVEVEQGHSDRHLEPNSEPMNFVRVAHDNGLTATYGHLSSGTIFNSPGDRVPAGAFIATIGSSGSSDRAHLHLELRDVNGSVVCPFRQGLWSPPVPYDAPPTFMDLMTRQGTMDTRGVKAPRPNITQLVAGGSLGVGASFAGGRAGVTARIILRRPNNTIFAVDTLGGSAFLLPHSFWAFNHTIPSNEPAGTWTIEGEVGGVVQRQTTFELLSAIQTVSYQAEDATLFASIVETEHAGFTGTGYVNSDNVSGSYVEWHAFAPVTGPATVSIRFANGTTTARTTTVRLNGTVVMPNLSFPPTGAWTTWATVNVNVTLSSGINDFRVTASNPAGCPNLDKIDVASARDARVDTDEDGLADVIETNTHIFRGRGDSGTDPANPDTDGDGLSDGAETLGTAGGLNLPAMGTNPLRKHILMEHDWFDDALECAPHSHRPTAPVIAQVTAAFANAPASNPDGSTGITLINDYGQGGLFTGGNRIPDADGVLSESVFGEFQDHKAIHFAANRRGYFHYDMMVHRYDLTSPSSGVAELPGDDLVVSLFCFFDVEQYVRNTILHELGHNLLLQHGGFDGTNYKPNYNSVMNYRYQFSGVDLTCDAQGDGPGNYSRGRSIRLDENALDERAGICGNVPIDWDFSGTIQRNLALDLNGDFTLGELTDFDDWTNVFYEGPRSFGAFGLETTRVIPSQIIKCEAPVPPP
jgi:hypothetical protein